LGFDVTVADSLGVDIGQRPEELIDVQLNLQNRHCCLQLVEKARCPIDCLGDIFENQVEVNFIFLKAGKTVSAKWRWQGERWRKRERRRRRGRERWRGREKERKKRGKNHGRRPRIVGTYPITIGVVKGLEFDDIGVAHDAHDLELTVLKERSR